MDIHHGSASIHATAHKARILSALSSVTSQVWMASSWRRCVELHRLDPAQRRPPQLLTGGEFRVQEEPLEPHRDLIEQGLFRLHLFLAASGYEVSFCSKAGVTVQNLPATGPDAEHSLERPGSLWTEEVEGTNGIGTCLWEARAISVFKSEHFFSRHTVNSCAAAPFVMSTGELLGVFNIATKSPTISTETHQMAFHVLVSVTDEVGKQLFRRQFQRHCLVEMQLDADRQGLFAVREEGTLVAVDKHARAFLGADGESIDGKSIWTFFNRDNDFLRTDHQTPSMLVRTANGVRVKARVTFPVPMRRSPSLKDRSEKLSPRTMQDVAGKDSRMQRNIALLERIREASLPVLLLGETGTGKDVLAEAIHANSSRAQKPFVALNCAAIPETLIDSELFGYSGGAFTGAKREGQPGRIVEANGGTLFLDEIGDMPLTLQTRLLRFLENAEVMPIGGGAGRRVDVKVISATNVSVIQAVKNGRFRSDLYYRLAGVVVNLPALRNRTDFETIATNVLAACAHMPSPVIAEDAMVILKSHSWPGNIRELRNVLQRALCFAAGAIIQPCHLFFDLECVDSVPMPCAAEQPDERVNERAVVLKALDANNHDVVETAKALGMSRATFYRRMKDLQIRQRGTRRIRIAGPG